MMDKANALRVPVLVDRWIYNRFKAHSESTGVPVSRLVRDAMIAYEVTLEARLKALKTAGGR